MINILYSGNYGVFNGLLTSILSIVKFNKEQINVFLLTMDLTDQDKSYKPLNENQVKFLEKILKQTNSKNTCVMIDMTEIYKKDKEISIAKRFTPYALLRLYSSYVDILPDKILYLDTDTLILNSIEELYNTNIENYEFAACKDYFGKVFIGRNYCNSGVLLMNMKKIRETKLLDRVRKMCIEKNLFLADQTALNKCVNSKLILPPKYNSQRRINKDTVIRHYCASWRFFPIIRIKNVKQWEVEKIFKDKHNVYNNECVSEILNEFLNLKSIDSYKCCFL